MILSRAECRALVPTLERFYVTEIGTVRTIIDRIRAEAEKPDELSPPIRIIPPADNIIRKGDRVSQSNRPGRRARNLPDMFQPETRIYGTVMILSTARARVLFDECDAIPFPDYAQWVSLSELRKEKPDARG